MNSNDCISDIENKIISGIPTQIQENDNMINLEDWVEVGDQSAIISDD